MKPWLEQETEAKKRLEGEKKLPQEIEKSLEIVGPTPIIPQTLHPLPEGTPTIQAPSTISTLSGEDKDRRRRLDIGNLAPLMPKGLGQDTAAISRKHVYERPKDARVQRPECDNYP